MIDISTIAQGYKMLTAPDPLVRQLAEAQLRDVTTKKIGRPAQPVDLEHYLSCDLEGKFAGDSEDIAFL